MKKQLICLAIAISIATIVAICEVIEGTFTILPAIKEQIFLVSLYILSFLGAHLIFPNHKEDKNDNQHYHNMLKYSTIIFYIFEMLHFLNIFLHFAETQIYFSNETEHIRRMVQDVSQLFSIAWDVIISKVMEWLKNF